MKRNIITVIMLLLLLSLATVAITINGEGTLSNPYIIDEASDFIELTNLLNEGTQFNDKYFIQTENIDLVGTNYVGAASSANFYGTYDGRGHTINVALDCADERNVFPYNYGKIFNLGTTGYIKSKGGTYICGLARSVRAGAVIANCYSTMNLSGVYPSGIAASVNGKLYNCYYAGIVNGTTGSMGVAASSKVDTMSNVY